MTTTPTRESLWDIEQAAAYLGVPVQTLYAWRKRHYGPPAGRVGRHLRYDPDDVRDWFRVQREAA
ncbi:excisionase family DNA binding protein [Actinoplanes lutulentus]|uniref:Excisionase family DNA binding protein n=1 Tax=Actinoplanes lutulentus TaxID=1287878 RepID=A0A327ZGF8_9ACTN|nr:helix-turn-helix domain-containing protein [Actinoplanes lutulentus]MBB2941829.1 excisionase family DNA binding protein [Actinoplanes lutulentus]RAK39748.1 excisionase family DNA binding protein [Actinoplanes lutulentus]